MKKKNNDTIKLLPIIVFSFVIGGIITLSILRWTPILDQVIGNRNTVITKNGTQIYEKSSLAASVEKVYYVSIFSKQRFHESLLYILFQDY